MRVGLVADTHGVDDPALTDCLAGVDAILHAGDVGNHGGHAAVLARLQALAPTTAVRGNVDDDGAALAELPETAVLHMAGWTVLLVHVLASSEAAAAIVDHHPDIVVHGHSHKYGVEVVEEPADELSAAARGKAGRKGIAVVTSAAATTAVAAPAGAGMAGSGDGVATGGRRRLHVNPGSAGPARFKLGRSVAVLFLPDKASGDWPGVERIELAAKAPPRLPRVQARATAMVGSRQQKRRNFPVQEPDRATACSAEPPSLRVAARAVRRRVDVIAPSTVN